MRINININDPIRQGIAEKEYRRQTSEDNDGYGVITYKENKREGDVPAKYTTRQGRDRVNEIDNVHGDGYGDDIMVMTMMMIRWWHTNELNKLNELSC